MARIRITDENVVDRMLDEWISGMLVFWVLGLLIIRPRYGLEIRKEIEKSSEGRIRLGVSTIYQLLRRLEKRGLATSWWEKNVQGPPRSYYTATPAGVTIVQRFIQEVLSPASPIPNALGNLTQQIVAQTTKRKAENEQHDI